MKAVRALLFSLSIASLAACAYPPRTPDAASTQTDAPPGAAEATVPADRPTAPPPPTVTNDPGPFAGLDMLPNIETAGVVVNGIGLPGTAELSYRRSDETAWHRGHPLMRIKDGRLVGSLFGLSPSTVYFVKVSDGAHEITGSTTTQPTEYQFTPLTVVYVDDDAADGGDGSAAAPYRTIQEGVDRAAPGSEVLVADGIYREAVTFPASGTSGKWIQVKAAGSGAILDGSESLAGRKWTAVSGISKIWFIKLGRPIAYLARDKNRFYNYDDLASLKQSRGHEKVTIKEGWFYDPATTRLYVRSQDNPAHYNWQAPYLNHAFDVNARDWIWIEGFEMRFYGTNLEGCGVCTVNASHVVIRKNKIHNIQLGIFINWNGRGEQGNDTRIEANEIFDPLVNEWPWKAVKGTSMEGTGIVLRGHIGAILRDNEIHNYFNGIYTGSSAALENPDIAFDTDIYDNYIHHIRDDGLEPEGTCINQRFRGNRVDTMLVGVSVAPVTQGPTWVIRNLFTNFSGTSIKWARDPDGILLIYHNTGWTNSPGLNAMSVITPMKNSVMLNNIFQGNGYAFEAIVSGATGNDWNYNNWHTTRSASLSHFKWENIGYLDMSQLCAATGLECNGHENPPDLVNPIDGDFTLLSSSLNIDRGIFIPGINDIFIGNAPDLGAYEFGSGR